MELVAIVNAEVINDLLFDEFGMKFITDGVQFGSGSVDGNWKLVKVGTDVIRLRRESSLWVDKGAFLA